MIKLLGILILFALAVVSTSPLSARIKDLDKCDNRFVTLVNPVRGRELWSDKTLNPLISQYEDSAKYDIPATWLLQYDAIKDADVVKTISEFKVSGEKGVFLEVSKKLATDAGVGFDSSVRWSHPGAVFLSAYTLSERRVIIDALYREFKNSFGYYPKSIGAWWIDSYSLEYIKNKYGLKSVMIVADQKTTDSYGVWGQWWGFPYIPSNSNVLVPAKDAGLKAVVIQWAQRDPVLAFGPDASFSNFSLQANDYIRNKKDTVYFESLASYYLDCKYAVGQITIGMETGMEALGFEYEYENQLKYLTDRGDLKFVTMSEFSDKFFRVNKRNPKKMSIGDWNFDLTKRENSTFGDLIKYNEKIAFPDYYLPDKSDFLNRNLSELSPKREANVKSLLFFSIAISLVVFVRMKNLKIWLSHLAFVIVSGGLIFRSGESLGWKVYYGLALNNIHYFQIGIYVLTLLVFYYLAKVLPRKIKDVNLFLAVLPLSFGIDGFIALLRITKIADQYLFGIKTFGDNIIGILIGNGAVRLLAREFPYSSQKYFYDFPFENIFSNKYLYLMVYPLTHLLLSFGIYFLLKNRRRKSKIVALFVLTVFYLVFLNIILKADPVFITPLI